MTTAEKVIEALVELLLIQDEELKKANAKIEQVKQYIDVYEEYIRGERDSWQQ
jgi:hypothetical protein